jgi:hypothetical protein
MVYSGMKTALLTLIFSIAFSVITKAQEAKPQILLHPAGWEFERFEMPPSFAPAITYKGIEELRFAPGMFKKDSADYFTYAFVAQIDKITVIPETGINDFLINYYRGLCGLIAKNNNLAIDTTQVSATVSKRNTPSSLGTTYDATVNIFGVFTDGAPVKLNMEITNVTNAVTKKTYLIFLASPRDKKEYIWDDLYEIRKKALDVVAKEERSN